MNKKLVAVAIAGLLAAPLAQAQTANVTLYGRLNMDVEWVNGKIITPTGTIPLNQNGGVQPAACLAGPTAGTVTSCITSNPSQFRVATNSSRFGLRGTESLGGGLEAIFQIESSVSPDVSGGTLAGRDSFLGLRGKWGTFRMGRFHAPYDNIHELWGSNPTLLTGILATSAIWAQGFATNTQQFDDRVANSVRWDSPVWSGFQLQAQYGNAQGTNSEGSTTAQASNSGVMSVGGFYNNGPVAIGLAWRQNMQQRARGLFDNAYSVAMSYQFPSVKIGAVYEKLDYECANGVAFNVACSTAAGGPGTKAGTTNLTRNMVGVGVTWNVGPGVLYADWSWGQEGKGSVANGARVAGLAKGPDSDANQYEISYNYPLSKRTQVYAGYNKVANGAMAAYNFGVNPYPSGSSGTQGNLAYGGRPQGFVIGMFHNF